MTKFLINKVTTKIVTLVIAITGAFLWLPAELFAAESGIKAAADQPQQYNRLVHESSPYLLQHATNPINWFPWGTEAFETAKKGGKPIFLSIGYSTCHWCHVMEHESFSDAEVAGLLHRVS